MNGILSEKNKKTNICDSCLFWIAPFLSASQNLTRGILLIKVLRPQPLSQTFFYFFINQFYPNVFE